jgi:hypothetical protein
VKAVINAPLPASAYITHNGLEWAWASPVNYQESLSWDFSVQGPLGWRYPTAAELLQAPGGMDFLFSGANVPFNGIDPVSGARFEYLSAEYLTAQSAGACASPYFQNSYAHCDFGNAPDQSLGPLPWAGQPGTL